MRYGLPWFVIVFLLLDCKKNNVDSGGDLATAVEPKQVTAQSAERPTEIDAGSVNEPNWLDKIVLPTTPTLDGDDCIAGSHLIEKDAFASRCQSEQDPSTTLVIVRPQGAMSSELNIMAFSADAQRTYGYSLGYVTQREVCIEEACVETAYGAQGLRLYETIIRDGSGAYMTRFHANGKKSEEGPLKSEGKFGSWTYYDLAGQQTHKVEHAHDAELSEP